ncbi:MAG: cell division protein FtsZ [Paludibacteraceae bacterium]|jgi:cell division protein FtsZ|nr:cell division protein FtsZ [Paludibacteraceae bacterium]
METNIDPILFNEKNVSNTFIKVIGAGGGGSNAVNRMYNFGIKDVSYAIFNTDIQDLAKSPVPVKVQLGESSTHGLGAGGRPEIGKMAAEEDVDKIKTVLSDNTRMAFITAGMGGGTGTGAAPVIARIAKDMNILTVGIVTIPFEFEGKRKYEKAKAGLEEMRKNVDALLVIDNRQLVKIYADYRLDNAFAKADEILSDATKGIADIINTTGYINVDFADVSTIMRDCGVAIMNTGYASGQHRITEAIKDALNSPLLHDNDVRGAERVLMYIKTSNEQQLTSGETEEITNFINNIGSDIEFIWGAYYDDNLEDDISVTIIATGFEIKSLIDEKPAETQAAPQTTAQPFVWGPQPAPAPVTTEKSNKEEGQSVDAIDWDDWANDDNDDEDINTPPSMRGK